MIDVVRHKKSLTSIALSIIFTLFFMVGCAHDVVVGNDIEATEKQMTKEEISAFLEENGVSTFAYFDMYFDEYFTPEEFIALCQKFEQSSLSPQAAISENLIVVEQDLSTYNKVEYNYAIVDISGEIIRDYGNNGNIDDVTRIGNFAFIQIADDPYVYDIIDLSGNIVSSFTSNKIGLEYVTDLGENYYVFCTAQKGWVELYLLDPLGNWQLIDTPAQSDLTYASVKGKFENVTVSGGVFGIVYGDCARYYNLNAECVLDLSYDVFGYKIIFLGAFEEEKAKISFWGVDGKIYDAVIDTNGDFVSDPVVCW